METSSKALRGNLVCTNLRFSLFISIQPLLLITAEPGKPLQTLMLSSFLCVRTDVTINLDDSTFVGLCVVFFLIIRFLRDVRNYPKLMTPFFPPAVFLLFLFSLSTFRH
jgi:hypothetical protein